MITAIYDLLSANELEKLTGTPAADIESIAERMSMRAILRLDGVAYFEPRQVTILVAKADRITRGQQ